MLSETSSNDSAVAVVQLRSTYWIRVAPPSLGPKASMEIRKACLRGVGRGIRNIVVDLTGVDHVCADGLDLLEAAGEALSAKQACLWVANTHDDGFKVIPASGGDLGQLSGLSAALDHALAAAGGHIDLPSRLSGKV